MATLYHCPWDEGEDWLTLLRETAPDVEFRVWPEIGPRHDIDSAVVWKLPAGVLKALPNLKCICSLGAGVDHIFGDPELPEGVPVTRLVDPIMGQRMAEYVLAEILRRQRKLDAYLDQQRRKEWHILAQPDAGDITIGIMGLGVLGNTVARTLASLGYDVAGWSQSPKDETRLACFHGNEELQTFLARSRYLVCLLPLTPATRGILNRQTFAAMPRGGHIINVGRGEHLVEADLLAALDNGTLSGATLDVTATEPPPIDHPFWLHPKIVVTPHVSSLSSARTAVEQIVANLHRCRRGEPLENVADPVRKY